MNKCEEILSSADIVVIDCFAKWCGPCKVLSPIIDEVSEHFKSNDKVKIYKCDVDDYEYDDITVGNNVRSVPTILIFKNEELVHRHIGLISKSDLIESIEKL